MRSVLVVAAMPLELRWLPKRTDLRWIPVANGPGWRLAAQGADAVGRGVDAVLSIGLCGALRPELRLGDIVVGSAVNGRASDLPESIADGNKSLVGPIASIDYVAGAAEKSALAETGAVAVEMEAAVLLKMARDWGKPFYCVKSVSDTLAESFYLDFNAARDSSGRFKVAKIVGQALRHPWTGLPELLRLSKNSKVAARALGEFLANCRF